MGTMNGKNNTSERNYSMKSNKRAIAVDLYKSLKLQLPDLSEKQFRLAVKAAYEAQLGMSDAGAGTYYYFARDVVAGKQTLREPGAPKAKRKKAAPAGAMKAPSKRLPKDPTLGQIWSVCSAVGETTYFISESSARAFAKRLRGAVEINRNPELE